MEYEAAMKIINRVKERNPYHPGLPNWARSGIGNAPTKTPVEPGVELGFSAGEPDATDF